MSRLLVRVKIVRGRGSIATAESRSCRSSSAASRGTPPCPESSPVAASMISPCCTQMRPSPVAVVILRIAELWVRHSSWMISTSVLLCTPRKPPCFFALEQRLDAIDEVDDLFPGLRLLDVEIDAHRVSAGAELFVLRRGHDDDAQRRKLAADDGEHLEAVHLRHAQIDEEQIERLAFEQRDARGRRCPPYGFPAGSGDARESPGRSPECRARRRG